MKLHFHLLFLLTVALCCVDAAESPIKPLKFKGNDFFMIGNWDFTWRGHPEVHPLMLQAGLNSGYVYVPMTDPAKFETAFARIKELAENYPELAVIVDLELGFVLKKTGDSHGLYTGEELEQRKQEFHRYISRLATLDNIIGYSLDEPENRITGTYQEWKRRNLPADTSFDQGIALYTAELFKWFKDEINRTHPQAYFMPVIAWWTVYDKSDKLYDVLIANQYPTTGSTPLTGEFHEVAYDARLGAKAVRKLNKASFIYCPPGFNILDAGRWKGMPGYTLEEIRYCWLAPVSMGAMGVMGWRMWRCTDEFARRAILPVMTELSAMTPWLTGENLDSLVTCDRNGWREHKLLKRDKMLGQEDEEYEIRQVAPRCTYIVRKNPRDNTVLILAANNCAEELEVEFKFPGLKHNGKVYDLISGERPNISANTLKVKLKPYGIAAPVIGTN